MGLRPLPLIGGCVCGALRYEVRGRPFLVTACHCLDCQKRTGSAYSMNMPSRLSDFVIVAGEPLEIVMPTPSGSTTTHVYCSTCFSRVCSKPHAMPGTASVRPGTLDDTRWLTPMVHLFARTAQPGAIPPGAAAAETMPPDFSIYVTAFQQRWESA